MSNWRQIQLVIGALLGKAMAAAPPRPRCCTRLDLEPTRSQRQVLRLPPHPRPVAVRGERRRVDSPSSAPDRPRRWKEIR